MTVTVTHSYYYIILKIHFRAPNTPSSSDILIEGYSHNGVKSAKVADER